MYKLSFEQIGGHFHVAVSGVLDPETDASIDSEIRRECERCGLNRVLIDIREATTRLSLLDNHEAAKTFRRRMGDSIRAVAIVDSPAFRAHSEMFELTSVNRGAIVKFFETEEEATGWLDGSSA